MTTLGGFMDPFALIDPSFLDVAGMGGMGDLSGGFGGGGGTRRRATMPADVLETPVRARDARACAMRARARMLASACARQHVRAWCCGQRRARAGTRGSHSSRYPLLAPDACVLAARARRARAERVRDDDVRARARAAAQPAARRRRCLRPWTDECVAMRAHSRAHARSRRLRAGTFRASSRRTSTWRLTATSCA
jgi:hypothetical protein